MSNSIIEKNYAFFEMYQSLRHQLMEILADEDLSFQPGGENQKLGELCVEIGEIEQSYIDSFKTFTQNFTYRHAEAGMADSVARLTAWYEALDRELKETISSLSEETIQNRRIDRGGGFTPMPTIQLHIYQEALLIFYGKVSVYLKAMGKPRPEQWVEWIG